MSLPNGQVPSSGGDIDIEQLNRLGIEISTNLMSSNLYNIPIFRGDESENVNAWINKFEAAVKHFAWDTEQAKLRMKGSLAGPAANWFRLRVELAGENSLEEILRVFRIDFEDEDKLERMRNRKMHRFEKIQSYVYDKVGLCKEVNPTMTESEILNYLYEGMPAKLANAISIAGPDNFYEVVKIGKRLENLPTEKSDLENTNRERKESSSDKILEVLMKEIAALKLSQEQVMQQNYSQNFRQRYNENRNRAQNNQQRNLMRCYTCGRNGHVARFCYMNGQTNQNSNNRNFDRRIPQMPNNINNNQRGSNPTALANEDRRIMIKTIVNRNVFDALVDTGAESTFISHDCWLAIGCELEPWTGGHIRGINGSGQTPVGNISFEAQLIQDNRGSKVTMNAIVLKYLPYEIIIGVDTLKSVNAVITAAENKVVFYPNEPNPISTITEETLLPKEQPLELYVDQGILIDPQSSASVKVSVRGKEKVSGILHLKPCPKFSNSNRLRFATIQIEVEQGKGTLVINNSENFAFFIKTGERVALAKIQKLVQHACMVDLSKTNDSVPVKSEENKLEMEKNHAVASELKTLRISKGPIAVGAALNHDQLEILRNEIEPYVDRFAFDKCSFGRTTLCQHQIDTGTNKPFSLPPYNVSLKERLSISEEIQRMKSLGVIIESTSPYSSPVIVVGKKDGGVRICGDFRRLNKDTIPDTYPLPSVQDALDCVTGCSYFTLIDLKSGYWQISIDARDREKTAIITKDGLFEFLVMPFGLRNAPATFQRLMDTILSDLKWLVCIPYLDDILIFSKTFEEHIEHLKMVLDRLTTANLMIQPPKAAFAVNAINYLGQTITSEGISPQEDKIKAVMNFPTPSNIITLRQFLGLASYHRRFIRDFSLIARPLFSLIKQNTPFSWGEEQKQAFELLKNALSTQPILMHFNNQLQTEVRCDGSAKGLGAILLQLHQDGNRIVAYASRLTTGSERNYAISELEALAVVFALEKFRSYLIGIKFKVFTDHCSLCWMFTKKKLSPRLTRWTLALQEFDFEVIYKSGKHHLDADCLSRNPEGKAEIPDIDKNLNLLTITNSLENLANLQRNDAKLNSIILLLENFNVPNNRNKKDKRIEKFTMVNNILNRCVYPKTGPKLVPVIPKQLRKEILYSMHDDHLSGHLGQQKTFERIRARFFWPKMKKYVINYVKTCLECQTRKRSYLTPAGLLQPITVGGVAEKFGIDILGPFPKSFKDNKIIVVATEYFTRFAITKALPEGTSALVAMFIAENIVCQFGSPKEILTDRGRQFKSKLMAELAGLMQSKHRFTTAYHPQCNGLTERFNATLATMISMYIDDKHKTWDQALHFLTFAYNSSVNESTGFSPFYLMYGRDPVYPIERVIQDTTQGISDYPNYVESLKDHLIKIRQIASDNLHKSQQKSKSYYDAKHRQVNLTVGQKVLIFTPLRKVGKSEKLMHNWYGPFKIIEVISPLVCKVENLNKPGKIDVVHVSRMKDFHERLISSSSTDCSTTTDSAIEHLDLDLPMQISKPKTNTNNIVPDYHLESETIVEEASVNEFVDYNDADSDSSEDEEVPVRERPKRHRKPPAKLADYLLTLICLFSIVFTSETSFIKINPVIWQERRTKFIEGVQQVSLKIDYESPCALLNTLTSHTNANSLTKWCETAFSEDFMNPLSRFCPEPERATMVKSKSKREIVAGLLLLGTVTISSFISVGLGAITWSKQSKLETDFSEMSKKQSNIFADIEKQKLKQIITEKVLRDMELSFDKITNILQEVNTRINILEQEVPKTIYFVAQLSNKFMRMRSVLKQAERKWNQGELENELLDLFNISLPCQNLHTCPIEMFEPSDCYLDTQKQQLILDFDVKITSKKYKLLQSDAFEFIQDNSTHRCVSVYAGPKAILFDKDSNCAVERYDQLVTSSYLNLYPKQRACLLQNSTNALWVTNRCFSSLVSYTDRIQVKFVKRENFIYCAGTRIELFNIEHKCPEFVFAIPSNISFKINNYTYHPHEIKSTNTLHFVEDWNFKVNMQFNPLLIGPLIDSLNTTHSDIKTLKTNNTIENSEQSLRILTAALSFIILILTIVTMIVIWVHLKSKDVTVAVNTEQPNVPAKRPLLRKTVEQSSTKTP